MELRKEMRLSEMRWERNHVEKVGPIELLLLRYNECLAKSLYVSRFRPKPLLLFHWQVEEFFNLYLHFLPQ